MSGRRNSVRYQLSAPRDSELMIAHDVVIESRTDHEVGVLIDTPQPRERELTLELGAAVAVNGIPVRVLDCTPVLVDGRLQYRLRLAVGDGLKEPAESV